MTQSWLRMKNQQKQGEKKSISTSIIHLPTQAHVCVCSLDLKVAFAPQEIEQFLQVWGETFAGWVREFYEQKQHRCIFLSAVSYQMELLN